MVIENPLWMQNNPYSARLDRRLIATIFSEGIIFGFAATQRGAGANNSIDIAAGVAIIAGDDQAEQGSYLVRVTSTTNVTGFSAAPASGNERYDVVYLRINDPNAGGPAGNNGSYGIVTGTAAAVGSAAIPATPSSAIPIARVRWTAGVGSITNAMITSMLVPSVAYGGDPIGSYLHSSVPESLLDARYVVADGREISRTTYATYFGLIGTIYGSGDGSTTFNVPDARGRTLFAADNMGGTAAGRVVGLVVGGSGGASTKTLSVAEMPAHSHVVNAHNHGGSTGTQSANHTHSMNNHTHVVSGTTSSGGSHSHDPGSIFPMVLQGFDSQLDVYDGGSAFGISLSGQTGLSGTHAHTFSDTSSGPSNNNTGSNSVNHTHTITAESPGTSTVGSGNGFSMMNPYLGCVIAVRVI